MPCLKQQWRQHQQLWPTSPLQNLKWQNPKSEIAPCDFILKQILPNLSYLILKCWEMMLGRYQLQMRTFYRWMHTGRILILHAFQCLPKYKFLYTLIREFQSKFNQRNISEMKEGRNLIGIEMFAFLSNQFTQILSD